MNPKIRVAPATYQGDVAEVRVSVDPGVLLRLGSVRYVGAAGVAVSDLEKAAALVAGAPYEVSVLDAAREMRRS